MIYKDWIEKFNLKEVDRIQEPAYCWVDVETTGLEIFTDEILEIGVVITNEFGEVIPDSLNTMLVFPTDNPQIGIWDRCDDFVTDMHNKSGLKADWNQEPLTLGYHEVAQFLETHVSKFADARQLYWAGANVGSFDKIFVQRTMPEFASYLHYRTVDVSSLKTMCAKLNKPVFENYAAKLPEKPHRPPLCLGESIREYQYYLDEFIMADWSEHDND